MATTRLFKSHFNRELCDKENPNGKWIGTRAEYLKELKEKNLVPYNKSDYSKTTEKPIKISKEAHQAVEHIRKTKGNPGSGWYKWLESKGMGKDKIMELKRKAEHVAKTGKDGFA